MADKTQKEPGFVSKALKVLMFPVAGISGFWATKLSMYNSAYTNASQQKLMRVPETKELLDMGAERVGDGMVELSGETGARTRGMKAVYEKMKNALLGGKQYEVTEESLPHHAKIDKIAEAHMENIGLGTMGKQWKFMRRDQKQQAIRGGLAVAGIATAGLGAVVNWLENKTLAQRVDEHAAKLDADKGPSVS